jgi:6-phosphogluconolactonase
VELWFGRRTGDGWRTTQIVPTTRRTAAERARSAAPVAPSALRLTGEHVVVATRGIDTVSVFALDRVHGTASFVAEVSCAGDHPRDLVVADGLVWVANQWSDEVVALDLAAVLAGRDTAPVHRVQVPRPACVVLPGTAPRSAHER